MIYLIGFNFLKSIKHICAGSRKWLPENVGMRNQGKNEENEENGNGNEEIMWNDSRHTGSQGGNAVNPGGICR